jgi:hypothetical protein
MDGGKIHGKQRRQTTAVLEPVPGTIDISMRRLSFHEWLKNRPDEAPDAGRLALLIAQSGAAGISPDGLRKFVRLRPETLDDLLKALVATGQVVVLKVDGQFVYRAAT